MKKQVFNPYLPSYEYIPDVCQGLDGKYYLYYCLDFLKEIGVAVCDEPALALNIFTGFSILEA